MSNPLTGDHDAVLQVSVGTLNRLMASMHQNEVTPDPVLPCLPHSAFVRIGDDPAKRIDGVQGLARVQFGVPKLNLIHLARDRVDLQVVLRAQVTTSSGSAPFPEFVHGTLRARYVVRELGRVGTPQRVSLVAGTGGYHPPRYHFTVDPGSVSFTSFAETAHDTAITRQAVALLSTVFRMPGGHPMLPLLMDRKLITLSAGGVQVVAVGLDLGPGDPTTEQPRQIERIFTAGRDVAVAANVEFVKSLVQPHLDALQTSTTTVTVDFLFGTVSYVVDVTSTALSWGLDTFTASGVSSPCGALDLTIEGEVRSSILNIPFTIRDRFLIAFNPVNHVMGVVPKGNPQVQANLGGIGPAESAVQNEITKQYKRYREQALVAAFPHIYAIASLNTIVETQLKVTDDQATVVMDSAEFSMDGIVVRGSVSLSPRAPGSVQIAPLNDLSGYTAFHSWLPGGRIDSFEWRWLIPHTEPDVGLARQVHDRFAFRAAEGMPGLPLASGLAPEGGSVCLIIEGQVIDPVTGAEVRAAARNCYTAPDPPLIVHFPFPLVSTADPAMAPPLPLWVRIGSDPELGISEAGRAGRGRPPCNTLLYLVSAPNRARSRDAIIDAVDQAGRDEAGLQMLVIVPEGVLDQDGQQEVRRRRPERDVALSLVEDIGGVWATTFAGATDSEEALRLITADGRVAWSHDGAVDVTTLVAALREHLIPADAPDLTPPLPGPPIGRAMPSSASRRTDGGAAMVGLDQSMMLCFALGWAESSKAELRRLNALAVAEDRLIVVVLTDAGSAEAAEVQRSVPQVLVLPDPDRAITDQHDIWLWPTTLTLDANSVISAVSVGIHPYDDVVAIAGAATD